jgi:hypothetical protein
MRAGNDGDTMSMYNFVAAAVLATTGALAAGEAEARDVDVQWSVTIGSPYYSPAPVYAPAPVYVRPPVYVAPAPVYWQRGGHYQQPRRWDRDGDGIPNRYDRRYNPRWDRDGDGVPNRYDRHPNGRHHDWHGRHGGRGGYDGRGGHDRGGRDHWSPGRGH